LFLYGYRYGIRSAGKLAHACQVNIEVIWLLKGLCSSKRTLIYFRHNNSEAIEQAHRHFVQILKEWKLIGGKVFAIDETKVHGQNSLKRNFNAKKLDRRLA